MDEKVRGILVEARRNRNFFVMNKQLIRTLVSSSEWESILRIHNLVNTKEA